MTIEIKRNTLWKQYGNIWHCRKTTISQFFSSSLWLWWDLEAWLGMAWQALALKVALATLMECMWHTRCLGDWTGVKCDEKPLRNHMVQFNTIYASWGLPASIGNLWVLVVILGVVLTHIYIYICILYPKKATFWSSGDFVDCPKFQKQNVEACWVVICRISNKANRAWTFFSFLEVEVKQICFCILYISTNQNYNDMWTYMIHIIHMIHMHSFGHIAELHHARKRPSIPSHQLLKSTLPRCGNAVVHLGFATCFKMLGLEGDGHYRLCNIYQWVMGGNGLLLSGMKHSKSRSSSVLMEIWPL